MALSRCETEGPRAQAVRTGAPVAILIAWLAAMLGAPPRAPPWGGGHQRIRGGPVDIGAAATSCREWMTLRAS
jgi:hypothetical protein